MTPKLPRENRLREKKKTCFADAKARVGSRLPTARSVDVSGDKPRFCNERVAKSDDALSMRFGKLGEPTSYQEMLIVGNDKGATDARGEHRSRRQLFEIGHRHGDLLNLAKIEQFVVARIKGRISKQLFTPGDQVPHRERANRSSSEQSLFGIDRVISRQRTRAVRRFDSSGSDNVMFEVSQNRIPHRLMSKPTVVATQTPRITVA